MPNGATPATKAHSTTRPGSGVEVCSARLVEFRAGEGDGWGPGGGFEAYAQLYGQPNDYNEIFSNGCFAASIAQRVRGPMGSRVRVNGSHSWEADDICGTVVDAREDQKGLWVKCLMSTVQSAQDLRTKLMEGHLDEFSIEFRAIRETLKRIGEETYRYIEEAVFWGLAILPYSSQGEPALISVRGASPYLDLPIAPDGTPWDEAAAAERVMAWACASTGAGQANRAQLRRAYALESLDGAEGLGFRYPIADIVEGRLQVVPQALMRAAVAASRDAASLDPALSSQVHRHLGAYIDRLRAESRTSAFRAPWEGSLDRIYVEVRSGASLAEADRVLLREALTTLAPAVVADASSPQDALAAGPDNPPTVTSSANARATSTAPSSRRAELREAQLRLARLALEEHSRAGSRPPRTAS